MISIRAGGLLVLVAEVHPLREENRVSIASQLESTGAFSSFLILTAEPMEVLHNEDDVTAAGSRSSTGDAEKIKLQDSLSFILNLGGALPSPAKGF
jgi:hypothetical protein